MLISFPASRSLAFPPEPFVSAAAPPEEADGVAAQFAFLRSRSKLSKPSMLAAERYPSTDLSPIATDTL